MPTNEEVTLLKQVVDATNANSFVYASQAQTANLVAAGLVEGNPAVVDAAGNMAYRATPAGITASQTPAPAAASTGAATHATYTVHPGFQAPAKSNRRPGGTGRTYPFESMELNSYIFVPATEKRPDPKKSLASTISSANKRFKDFSPQRYFRTYRAQEGQKFGELVAPSNGAYIVRVDPPVAKPAAAAPAAA